VQEEFRALLYYLNPKVDTWLPSYSATIQEWTIHVYNTKKQQIKLEVQLALSKVYFIVDFWTSPNSLAIVRIIAHYIADSGHLEHSVLALQELDKEHSGQNLADSVIRIIKDYRIASKVRYFVIDNASNNNTMIEALSTCMYK
jgi:cell division protein FtsB